ncbi:hypothetical protein CEXT_394661 [Caerostris extrusa]|uniref:Uncharacterized protein n=1 Tax=Caerostris extrusa TaxID=172846 RepID=A0AAV4VKP4_CAEEX|nr:hypothetical protein CEXT_394661 [Caerostris extrusa]
MFRTERSALRRPPHLNVPGASAGLLSRIAQRNSQPDVAILALFSHHFCRLRRQILICRSVRHRVKRFDPCADAVVCVEIRDSFQFQLIDISSADLASSAKKKRCYLYKA